jgi:hypothetical protein
LVEVTELALRDGHQSLLVAAGDAVQQGQILVEFE